MNILDFLANKGKDNSSAMEIVRKRTAEAGWKIKTDNSGGIVLAFESELGIENVFIKPCGKKMVKPF